MVINRREFITYILLRTLYDIRLYTLYFILYKLQLTTLQEDALPH